MTLTFLDLYNSAASQEWSMYDNDAANTGDMEKPLVIALNKAVTEILYSYPFSFRERTHVLFTVPHVNNYSMPKGIIKKNAAGEFCVKINSHSLKLLKDTFLAEAKEGLPEGFYIRGPKLILYPTPNEKFILTIDYISSAIGEDSSENDIYELKNAGDKLSVPEHLENVFQYAVISRAMLNSISSESDENYSAYKKQSEIAYKQLVKFAKGVWQDKAIKI